MVRPTEMLNSEGEERGGEERRGRRWKGQGIAYGIMRVDDFHRILENSEAIMLTITRGHQNCKTRGEEMGGGGRKILYCSCMIHVR